MIKATTVTLTIDIDKVMQVERRALVIAGVAAGLRSVSKEKFKTPGMHMPLPGCSLDFLIA